MVDGAMRLPRVVGAIGCDLVSVWPLSCLTVGVAEAGSPLALVWPWCCMFPCGFPKGSSCWLEGTMHVLEGQVSGFVVEREEK